MEPRTTNDIDIVIRPTLGQLRVLIDSLEKHQYASRDAAEEALARESMFNVIDTSSGWKVDFLVRKSRPYAIEEFNRRKSMDFLGHRICFISPEDSILSKLEWAKKNESERQFRDAESVAVLQWPSLDFHCLRKWARELSIEDELNQILKHAESLQDENE